MNIRKRNCLFGLTGLIIILLALPMELTAQDNDESEKDFTNILISLDFHHPSITPFPHAKQKVGISFSGENPPLLRTNKIRMSASSGWDRKTRYLYYSREYYNQKIETPRYADYLTNARVYGDEVVNNYWAENLYKATQKMERDKAAGLVRLKLDIPTGGFLDAIAGESTAGLNVTGYQKIQFSGRSQWTDTEDDALNKVSKFPSLDMKQISRYNITGTIGTKITVEVDQNSERKTDLANTMKIRYKGTEDEIIQTIEAGNTNLSLPNTQFVGYSQRVQGLFGIKATARVGPLDLTAIISQEKGSTESASFEAGAAKTPNYKRDYDYLERTYFWLGTPEELDTIAEVLDARIYVFHQITSGAAGSDTTTWYNARIAVNPNLADITTDPEYLFRTVKQLPDNQYFLYEQAKYLEMLSYERTRLIAGYFRVRSIHGVEYELGSLAGDTLVLKLIAQSKDDANPEQASFYNEWKNVYSLGVRDIDPTDFDVRVLKGDPGTETQEDYNLDHQNSTPYLEILGLDQRGVSVGSDPDGKVDATDPNILLTDRGYLIFPPVRANSQPFNPPEGFTYDRNGVELAVKVPEIYNTKRSTINQNPSKYTKYYIEYKTKQRLTEYLLGHINVIENSERVVLNGEELKKDSDYRIYYELGRITFLTDKVLDPNADLQIDYEYEPFISSEKKNLFGIRAQYEINPKFKIGTIVLYKAEKSIDRKPRVGQETSKSLVWASDFSYGTDLPFLTKLTDALPFIEASQPSPFSISGEIAQSRPNPNTAGEAFVDDFESSREALSLGIIRYQWHPASAPLEIETGTTEKGKIIWYNPYDAYALDQIYNRDVGQGNDRKTTLTLKFEPAKFKTYTNPDDPCVIDSVVGIDSTTSWSGIMRALSSGSQNQTEAQLLEIRMRVNGGRGVDKGQLILNLGEISEDINGDGALNTEDANNNGILESFEDVGLDGLPDENEPCYDPVSNPDPSGDDFNYDNKDNYSQINGTEGNRYDAGGSIPDSEDLDGTGSLDVLDNYFKFVIDFEKEDLGTGFKVENSNLNGWETYRIPIKDVLSYEQIGTPNWDNISYARYIVTGFDSAVTIEIADADIVTTRWVADSIHPRGIPRPTIDPPRMSVSVISQEVDTSYQRPPGVGEYYDKSTDTYEREQSLLLKFENLRFNQVIEQIGDDSAIVVIDSVEDANKDEVDDSGPILNFAPDTVFVVRNLFKAEDYAGYQVLKMFVHAPEDTLYDGYPEQPLPIHFIFRMGRDDNNFYQFQTNLYPGWDDRNEVVIDFNQITPLKDTLASLHVENPEILQYQEGHYAVKGNPSLTSIIYFSAGVTTTDFDHPLSGEVWLDELRLTDVLDDAGSAMRLSFAGGLSDFVTYSINYKKQDEYFRNLTAGNSTNLGSGKSLTTYSYTANVNLHKALPPSWGVSLPIGYGYSETRSTPRLKPGSDIIIPEGQKEDQTTVSKNWRFSIKESFRKQGGNLLFGLLLNRLRTSYSYNKREGRAPTNPVSRSEDYTAQATYDLSPSKSHSMPIFFWLKPLPLLPKSISESQFGYLPTKLDFSGTVKKTYSTNINNQAYRSTTYNRTFNGSMNLKWAIFKVMNADYSYKTDRDIRDADKLKFSFNPKNAMLGIELQNTQALRLEYGPSLFKFLTHKVSYRSNYTENADPTRNQNNTRNVSNGTTITLSSTFIPRSFFGSGGKSKAPPKTDSTGAPEKGGISIHKPFLAFIRFFTNRLDDIQGSYSVDRKFTYWGLQGRPGWKYIFGFVEDPNVPIDSTVSSGNTKNSNTESISYSGRTGVKFILGSKIATSYAHSESESSSRTTRGENTTFPDLSFSLSNLDRYRVFGWFFDNLSFDTRFSRKIDNTYNKSNTLDNRNTADNYSPLMKLNFTWFKKLQCTFQYDKSKTLKETFNTLNELSNEVRQTTNSWQFTTRATISSPQGINFPLFGKLKSTLTLNLTVSKKNTKSENNSQNDEGWSTTSDKDDFTVVPRISYSFSSNINGGLSARWQDSNDKTRFQKSHVRELGIWVEIKF